MLLKLLLNNWPHSEWSSRLCTNLFSVKCLVLLTIQPDIVVIGFLGISYHIPSMTFTVINGTKVSFSTIFCYTKLSIYKRKLGCMQLWFHFLCWVSWNQRWSETSKFVTNKMDIRGLHSAGGHWNFRILNYTALYSQSPITLIICLPPSVVDIHCGRTDLHQRPPIRLHQVGSLAQNMAQMALKEHQIIILEIHWAKTPISGNSRININSPPGYSYPSSHPPFPHTSLFYNPTPYNITPSSQPTSAATREYLSYGRFW